MKKNPSEIRAEKRYTIFDIRYLRQLLIENKKWFALSVVFCLCCGLLYIYLVHPSYNVSGKILVTEKKASSSSASSAAVMLANQLPLGLGSSLGGAIGIENEKEIIGSKLLARNVVNHLGLHTEYRLKKFIKKSLVYKSQPVIVTASPQLLQFMDDELPLKRHVVKLSIQYSADGDGYQVDGTVISGKNKTEIAEQHFKSLPATIKTRIGTLTLSENKELTAKQVELYAEGYELRVTVIPPSTAARQFSKRLNVSSASKKATNTVNLSMNDESILRGMDYINCLVDKYNEFSTDEKHKEVSKYDQFVKERLEKVDEDLGLKDETWESFKKRNQVTDLKADAEEIITKKSAYETQIVGLGIQLQLLDYLKQYVDDPANAYEIIPVNMGVFSRTSVSPTNNTVDASPSSLSTGDAINLISRHNAMVTERNLLLKSATEMSPQVKKLTTMIEDLHPAIQNALHRDITSLRLRNNTLEREYNKYIARVSDAPEQERTLTEIGRQRKVKEGVYLSLLQKREENAMDLINTVDKGRFIDMVQYNKKVKPKTLMVLLLALVLGLVLPYLYFFLRRGMRSTIGSYDELAWLSSLPILGIVPESTDQTDEAFRSLRTNLLYQKGDDWKVILLTSHSDGDGKTYISDHLAEALANIGKKVIVCDMDFRHPSVGGSGISAKYDVLPAKNDRSLHPADILGHQDMAQTIASLKDQYDVVILDAPAIGTYQDAYELAGLADMTCFICRAGKTPRQSVDVLSAGRLPVPCLILNRSKK